MDERELPVTVAVTRPDGRVEQVRVGTAIRSGDGFTLRLGDLAIGPAPARARAASPAPAGAMVFPPYGRSAGAPIEGASMRDLEFYAQGSRRSLADPAKSRWHEKERVLLAAIEAEIAHQQGGAPPPASDDEAPPPTDDDIPF